MEDREDTCGACLSKECLVPLKSELWEHFYFLTQLKVPTLCWKCYDVTQSSLSLRNNALETNLTLSQLAAVSSLTNRRSSRLIKSEVLHLGSDHYDVPSSPNISVLILPSKLEDGSFESDSGHADYDDGALETLKEELPCDEVKEEKTDAAGGTPLTPEMLRKKVKSKKRKKHKIKKRKEKKEKYLELEPENARNEETRPEQEKRVSKRMVLETDEYTVIRLSLQEVNEERDKALSGAKYQQAPYKCEDCVKGFNYPDVWEKHRAKHTGPGEQCSLCKQIVPSATSLRGHLKSHFTKYRCKACGEVRASRQHMLEHYGLLHTHTPPVYVCNVCGKTLTKRTMFQKHVKIHFPSTKLPCEKCGKLFKSIETLRAHMLHHEDSKDRHADQKKFSCDQCPKTFRYASLLYTHKVTHVQTRDFYCVECDLRFKTQSNLRLHLRKASKHADPATLKWACGQCARRYAGERALRAHGAWAHLRQRNYACAACARRFGSADGLRAHRRRVHDGVRAARAHACPHCDKAFRAKAVLVKHIRVHTGERPFECSECGKKFAQLSTLNTHVRLVHLKLKKPKIEPAN